MGKKLAIKGHATRGDEVISLLEMMGGANSAACGYNEDLYYFMGVHNIIDADNLVYDGVIIFTLEEFLEKYPFKVYDKVIDEADGCPGVVCAMKWDEDVSDMKYCVAFANGVDFGWFANDSIEFCKENKTLSKSGDDMETKVEYPGRNREDVLFDSIIWHLRNSVNNGKQYLSGGDCEVYFRELVKKVKENDMESCKGIEFEDIKKVAYLSINNKEYADEIEVNLGDDYEYKFEMNKLYILKKKPVYPKTLGDCCKVINNIGDYQLCGHKYELLFDFQNLLICRDAYWKIAGEQMRLDKPWVPEWKNTSQIKHSIWFDSDGICMKSNRTSYAIQHVLSFPTTEMRDAFYENFKDLIEQCKELL